MNKSVGELARVLLSFKQPTHPRVYGVPPQQRSDDWNDTLSNAANFMLLMQASLLYAARCKAEGGKKVPILGQSMLVPNASSPRVLIRMSRFFKHSVLQ